MNLLRRLVVISVRLATAIVELGPADTIASA